MIARYIIPILLLIILPDIYLFRYSRKRGTFSLLKTLLLSLITVFMSVFSLFLSTKQGYNGGDQQLFETYLLLFGVLILPKVAYSLCSFVGHIVCRLTKKSKNWGNLLGLLLGVYCAYIVLMGSFVGFRKMTIKEVEVQFANLPAAFDGYRIALFSDAHIGSYSGNRTDLLRKFVETINAQNADMIVFAGDLQNVEPQELYPHRAVMKSLTAPDGVVSVLGNHDYSAYADVSPSEAVANERELQNMERQFGWRLLLNDHFVLHRDNDSIVIAGLENHGKDQTNEDLKRRNPQRGDTRKALTGVADSAFIVMIEHDPSAWRNIILPETSASLTLSGHTHGGQIRPFSLSPTDFVYSESNGLYWENDRAIYVTSGLGGLIPLRYGVTPEVVVITLRRK